MNAPEETTPPEPPPFRFIFTGEQWFDIFALPLTLAALFALMVCFKHGYMQALWTTELGIKMLISGLASFALGNAILIALSLARPKLAPGTTSRVLVFMATLLTFVLFILPVIFVILVGPAAIQIVEGFR